MSDLEALEAKRLELLRQIDELHARIRPIREQINRLRKEQAQAKRAAKSAGLPTALEIQEKWEIRRRQIYDAVSSGQSIKEVAKEWGISPSRVHIVLRRVERDLKK